MKIKLPKILGVILTVVSIFGIVLQIWYSISDRKAKLQVKVCKERYVLPDQIAKPLADQHDNYKDIEKSLMIGLDTAFSKYNANSRYDLINLKYDLKDIIIDTFNTKIPKQDIGLDNFSFYYKVVIENSSDVTLKDVTWNTGKTTYFQYVINGKEEYGSTQDQIEISSLRPHEKVTIYAWSAYYLELNFVHENGSANVKEENPASIDDLPTLDFSFLWIILAIYLATMTLLFWQQIVTFFKMKRKQDSDSDVV